MVDNKEIKLRLEAKKQQVLHDLAWYTNNGNPYMVKMLKKELKELNELNVPSGQPHKVESKPASKPKKEKKKLSYDEYKAKNMTELRAIGKKLKVPKYYELKERKLINEIMKRH